MKYRYTYIVSIQFLGFCFNGWQKKTNDKTIHGMVDKSLSFVLENVKFKTLGVGRTDSKVSANVYFFQLFISEKIEGTSFLERLNSNFPNDFRALSIEEVKSNFNIIQHPKSKEYHYYFSFGEKNHPFTASLLVGFTEDLAIDLMMQGAVLFEGEHYFHKYCTKPSEHTIFKRKITSCKIVKNTIYTANFFPKESYVLKVRGTGFLRYQIRLMMGVLLQLGKGEVTLEFIKESLKENNDRKPLKTIAPSSGLQLYAIRLL